MLPAQSISPNPPSPDATSEEFPTQPTAPLLTALPSRRSPNQDKDGYTPLHIAAGYLHKGIVRKLLDAGADPELEDKKASKKT